MRVLLSLLGFVSVGFGVAGLFLPVWPSTVFFLIALALFAKSNPRMEKWILEHPKIGSGLRAWREEGAIARSAKIAASVAILLSIGASIYLMHQLWVQLALAVTAIALVLFLCSRPEPSSNMRKPLAPGAKGNDAA